MVDRGGGTWVGDLPCRHRRRCRRGRGRIEAQEDGIVEVKARSSHGTCPTKRQSPPPILDRKLVLRLTARRAPRGRRSCCPGTWGAGGPRTAAPFTPPSFTFFFPSFLFHSTFSISFFFFLNFAEFSFANFCVLHFFLEKFFVPVFFVSWIFLS